MKTIYLAALIATPFMLSNCKEAKQAGDISFAKSTFESLARGDSAVHEKIDWAMFQSLGTNVGAEYVNIPTDQERADYRNAYITQFSSAFREQGGSVDNFTNWRVTFHDSQRTEVAADSAGGLLKMTVTNRDDIERVSSIGVFAAPN
jgi:hypothetical protein